MSGCSQSVSGGIAIKEKTLPTIPQLAIPFQQILASSLGSIAATITLNPINVIKVHLQQQSYNVSNTSNHIPQRATRFLTLSVIKSVLEEPKGIRGLWSGTTAGMVMSVPSTVIYMAVYDKVKNSLLSTAQESRPADRYIQHSLPAVAGAFARLISASIVSPLELIRTVQTASRKDSAANSHSVFQVGRNIYKNSGFIGLYRGWLPTILRDCPYSAIYWVSFEFLQPILQRNVQACRNDVEEKDRCCLESPKITSSKTTFLSGSLSGLIAAVCTHPFDVLKTQQQLNSSQTTLVEIVRKGGLLSLYTGLTMRLSTVIPGGAIMVTVYEYVKSV